MSAQRSTEELVGRLAADLERVRPIPRLRAQLAIVLAFWAVVSVLLGSLVGLRADALDELGFAALAGALVLVGVGGTVAALSASVPGRERTARFGSTVLVLGVVSGVLCGFGAVFGASPAPVFSLDLKCSLVAAGLALPALAPLLYFVVRALPVRSVRIAILSGLGAMGLGAITVHFCCAHASFGHLVAGHALLPFALAGLFAVPTWLLIARAAGRASGGGGGAVGA